MSFNTSINKSTHSLKSIGSACQFITGYAFKSKDFATSGKPIIKIKNIQDRIVRANGSQYIPNELITSKLNKFKLSHGDILIAMTGQGSVGKVGKLIINDSEVPYLNQRVGKFIANEVTLNNDYLYYVISSEKYKKILFNAGIGSGQPNLSPDIIKNIEIPFPQYKTQKKIAYILSTLDDKIELNRKMSQILEKMAQALFKSWFINFDPAHAKANFTSDNNYEQIAKELGIRRKVLDLFPDEFEESELGLIPKGWKFTNLNSIFTEQKVKVKERTDVSVMSVIKTGEIVSPEEVFTKQVHSKDISKYKLIHPLDLGYNPSRINIGSVGFNKKDVIGAMSPIYTVMKLNDKKYYPFSELFIRDATTKEWIRSLSSGSVRLSLSQKDFLSISVVLPSDVLLDEFNSIYNALYEVGVANKIEIKTLQKTRDTLLPKFLSGELDVSELELNNVTH